MATRTLNKLTAKQVEALGPGRHSDGGALYLVVDEHGRRNWSFQPKSAGKRREIGVGPAGKGGISLADARKEAALMQEDVRAGRDPKAERDKRRAAPVKVSTFGELADEFVKSQEVQWRNEKHRAQWAMTLKVYAAPLRPLPVDRITTDDVLKALKPIWLTKPETASRTRGRIERVLDAAKAKGFRDGMNPAMWRGHLSHLLPRRQKLSRGHQRALPYQNMSAFMAELRQRQGQSTAALALEFLILTAARSGEVRGATWAEIDHQKGVWTVPAARMKAGREHRVPLTERASTILTHMRAMGDPEAPGGGLVFPGPKDGKPLSENAFAALLERMDYADAATAHGFRSAFRDWAGETSQFPRELAEGALAHVVGDATERAYARGDALAKRKKLMDAWAGYCEPKSAGSNVTPIGQSRRARA
jgi:integrase